MFSDRYQRLLGGATGKQSPCGLNKMETKHGQTAENLRYLLARAPSQGANRRRVCPWHPLALAPEPSTTDQRVFRHVFGIRQIVLTLSIRGLFSKAECFSYVRRRGFYYHRRVRDRLPASWPGPLGSWPTRRTDIHRNGGSEFFASPFSTAKHPNSRAKPCRVDWTAYSLPRCCR